MKPKYHKGPLVKSIDLVANAIVAGKCLYLGSGRIPLNSAWLQNMTLWTLNTYVEHGRVWYAIENKEEVNG